MITGWGRITNNLSQAKKDLRKFKVPTRTLLKVDLPVANSNPNCKFYVDYNEVNLDKQICVGGVEGMLKIIPKIILKIIPKIKLTLVYHTKNDA